MFHCDGEALPTSAQCLPKPVQLQISDVACLVEESQGSPQFDEAKASDLVQSFFAKAAGRHRAGGCTDDARWWVRPHLKLTCPLTHFPISLLPYPPFKLRLDPEKPSPHCLVDGKFLAMRTIVTGKFMACGRELQTSDVNALDIYMQRCKLGPFRPGRLLSLSKQAERARLPKERIEAAKEVERFCSSARAELGKLRRIQFNRLQQCASEASAEGRVAKGTQSGNNEKPRDRGAGKTGKYTSADGCGRSQRVSSNVSTASTSASSTNSRLSTLSKDSSASSS